MTVGQIAARYAPQRFDGPLTVGETRDYSYDCAADLPAGSSVTSASLAIAPSGTLECTIDAVTLAGTVLTARIAAGQPRVYTALWTFLLDGGPRAGTKLEYVTEIACNPRRGDETATAPDSADFGTPSTATP